MTTSFKMRLVRHLISGVTSGLIACGVAWLLNLHSLVSLVIMVVLAVTIASVIEEYLERNDV